MDHDLTQGAAPSYLRLGESISRAISTSDARKHEKSGHMSSRNPVSRLTNDARRVRHMTAV